MWRVFMLVALLVLGGCVSYRSVSGKIFRPGTNGGELAAALDSGSTTLKCDPSQVRLRTFATGKYRRLLVVDGCGQRASYLTDCSGHEHGTTVGTPPAPQCLGAGAAFGAGTRCPDLRYDVPDDEGHVCDLVLISKVQLD